MREPPFVALEIARQKNGQEAAVLVRRDTAELLGWLQAYPLASAGQAAYRASKGARGFAYRNRKAHHGGTHCNLYLERELCPSGGHRRLRFRRRGVWTHQDLIRLVRNTRPEVHAVDCGLLSYHIREAALLEPLPTP